MSNDDRDTLRLLASLKTQKTTHGGFELAGIPFESLKGDAAEAKLEDLISEIVAFSAVRKQPSGIIATSLPSSVRRCLEINRISYVTDNGYAAIFLPQHTLMLHPRKRLPKHATPPPMRHLDKDSFIQPSRIINATGLAFLDAILRESRDLNNVSALSFAKIHNLSQSALSKVMTGLGAANLSKARQIIRKQPRRWWLDTMTAPRTGRGMTPFFEAAESYRIRGEDWSRSAATRWLHEVLERYNGGLQPGPLEVAKSIGAIADPTVTLWVEASTVGALKRDYKLTPARIGEIPLCSIAVPKLSLRREAIISTAPESGHIKLPSEMLALNLFRTVWDLGFADSRGREAQSSLLDTILDAI